MHVGVITLVAICDRIDHGLWPLSAGSIVQKRERNSVGNGTLQDWKVVTTMGECRHVCRRCGLLSGDGKGGLARVIWKLQPLKPELLKPELRGVWSPAAVMMNS